MMRGSSSHEEDARCRRIAAGAPGTPAFALQSISHSAGHWAVELPLFVGVGTVLSVGAGVAFGSVGLLTAFAAAVAGGGLSWSVASNFRHLRHDAKVAAEALVSDSVDEDSSFEDDRAERSEKSD